MLKKRLKNINKILKKFSGENGEPANDTELYILKSMWVMLLAEFEGSLKDLVENYIDKLKRTRDVRDMHVCFLLQSFYGNLDQKEEFTINEIINVYRKEKSEITYLNFTRNKKATYKQFSVEKLFNSLGVFLSNEEATDLKRLDGIASTRDAISHGDYNISITCKELQENTKIVNNIYLMLKRKLKLK